MKCADFSAMSNIGQLRMGNNRNAAKRIPAGKYQLTVPETISNCVLNNQTL